MGPQISPSTLIPRWSGGSPYFTVSIVYLPKSVRKGAPSMLRSVRCHLKHCPVAWRAAARLPSRWLQLPVSSPGFHQAFCLSGSTSHDMAFLPRRIHQRSSACGLLPDGSVLPSSLAFGRPLPWLLPWCLADLLPRWITSTSSSSSSLVPQSTRVAPDCCPAVDPVRTD